MENNNPTTLTASQEHVLAQISAGHTIRAAASAAGVHRNTIAYWLQTSPDFHQAFEEVQAERALAKRSEAEERLEAAYAALDRILVNPEAPLALVVKVALAMIDRASAPLPKPEPKPQPPAPQAAPSSQPPAPR